MKLNPDSEPIIHYVDLKNTERWNVYRRLQELEIPCRCSTNLPLQVDINNPQAIAQLCSVVKQITASRSELIGWLNQCWKRKSTLRRSSQ